MQPEANNAPPVGTAPASKPRRGRPVGWTMPTFADLNDLTLEDFSFLRGVIGGMEPEKAFKRFYANKHFDARGDPVVPHGLVLNAKVRELQKRILDAAFESADRALFELAQLVGSKPSEEGVSERDEVPGEGSSLPAKSDPKVPKLEEWMEMENVDQDFYTEAELLKNYAIYLQEHSSAARKVAISAANSTSGKSEIIKAKIAAINRLQTTLACRPAPSNDLFTWLAPSVQEAFAHHGVRTMGALVEFIGRNGRHWYRVIAKLGQRRAERLMDWIESNQETLGSIDRSGELWERAPALHRRLEHLSRPSSASLLVSAERGSAVLAPSPALPQARGGIAPFELMLVPAQLDGSNGLFRTRTPNHYAANNDYDAVRTWLGSYLNAGKMRTFDAYRREIERFYLWCLFEARVAISSVSLGHALGYQSFLRQIPDRYITAERVTREDVRWRPWRGQLDEKSQQYALGVVSQFFNDAHRNAYVTGNPFSAVKSAARHSREMDTTRSLNRGDVDWVRTVLADSPSLLGEYDDGGSDLELAESRALRAAIARRKRLILHLAITTGLRLSEMASATLQAMRPGIVDGVEQAATWVLDVEGKGKKWRLVPIHGSLRQMILEHHEDLRRMLKKAGASGMLRLEAFERSSPLICALRAPVPHVNPILDGEAEMANDNLALGTTGLYRTLKSFFRSATRAPLREYSRSLLSVRAQIIQSEATEPGIDVRVLREQERQILRDIETWTRRSSMSTHWLRHTFAMSVLRANPEDEGLKMAQQLLGHASITTTQVYIRQDESSKIRAVKNVNPLGL